VKHQWFWIVEQFICKALGACVCSTAIKTAKERYYMMMEHDHQHHDHRHIKMNLKIEELSSVKKKLNVKIDPSEFKSEFEATLKKFQQQAQIKGFRAGKAPIDMVRKQFKAEVEKETVGELIKLSLHEIITHNDLQPLDYPVLENRKLDPSGSLEFAVTLEVKPKLKVKNYTGMKLTRDSKKPGDAEINNVLTRLQEQHAKLIDKVDQTQNPEAKDFVVISADLKINGKSIEKIKVVDRVIPLGGNYILPELETALMTMKPGEIQNVPVSFPKEFGDKALAGKSGIFDLTLHTVKTKLLPELNDEFAKITGEAETFVELRKNISERLNKEAEQLEQENLHNEVIKQMISANPFEVPPTLVKHRFEHLMQQWVRGGLKVNNEAEAKKAENDCYNVALSEVSADLLLETVAAQEKIEIADSDVDARIEALLASNVPNRDEARVTEIRGYLNQPERREMMREQILRTKTLDFILGTATIKEAKA
jgi:trigger factor